jgi:hypothetical protein
MVKDQVSHPDKIESDFQFEVFNALIFLLFLPEKYVTAWTVSKTKVPAPSISRMRFPDLCFLSL